MGTPSRRKEAAGSGGTATRSASCWMRRTATALEMRPEICEAMVISRFSSSAEKRRSSWFWMASTPRVLRYSISGTPRNEDSRSSSMPGKYLKRGWWNTSRTLRWCLVSNTWPIRPSPTGMRTWPTASGASPWVARSTSMADSGSWM